MTQESLIAKLHGEFTWKLQELLSFERIFIRKVESDEKARRRWESFFSLVKRELSIRGELRLPDICGAADDGEE